MERLLRGVIQVGTEPEAEEAYSNWLRLQDYSIEYQGEEDRKIYNYLKNFYGSLSSPPDFSLVREYFEKQDDIETVARLDQIKKSQVFIRTNYISIAREEQSQQQIKAFTIACRDAAQICEHGRNLDRPMNGKKVLRGVQDAVGFFYEKMSYFSQIEAGEKLEGNTVEDADEVWDEYEVVEKTGKFARRNLFGLDPVDSACRGHRTGEFWVHCANSGELKTTTALNYLYNNCYVYGKNIFYAIMEMPYKQLRRQLYVIHSSNGKFVTEWHREDIKAGRENPYVGIDYRKVRDGELSPLEKTRFRKIVQDFKATCKGKPYIWRPAGDIRVMDIQNKAEVFNSKYGCDGIVLDHIALIQPRHRTQSTTDRMNDVVREARMMALNFCRGRTVPVLGLLHINRQGKLLAEKNDGHYNFAAISYANETEKSADVITYTYLDDNLRNKGQFYFGCMKNRDNPHFERMIGKIVWLSKRMRAIEPDLLDSSQDNIKIQQHANMMSILTSDDMLPAEYRKAS